MLLLEAERWWDPRRGGKSRAGGIFVGVVGSERNSRSNPPALIFIRVSFSGVMSFAMEDIIAISNESVQLKCADVACTYMSAVNARGNPLASAE